MTKRILMRFGMCPYYATQHYHTILDDGTDQCDGIIEMKTFIKGVDKGKV